MTIVPTWMLRFAGHSRRHDRALAEASRDTEERQMEQNLTADEVRFRTHMEEAARVPHVVLGTTETGVPYRIPLDTLTSLPMHGPTAATGAGKSRAVCAVMEQVIWHIVRGAPVALVVADGKGDTEDQVLRSVARVAEALSREERRAFLSRVYTFRFFDTQYLPSWPLTARVPGVSIEAQADAVAEVLIDVQADATVGPRQRQTLAAFEAGAIEFDIPLAAQPWVLNDRPEVAALAARSSLPSVRLELSRFERESQGSIDGLIVRLGTLLRAPSLKAALSGPRPFDFTRCFEPGSVSVFSFAGADLGARAAVRATGSLTITALANAAFDPRRRVRGTTMFVIDEPQALMTSVTVGQLERLMTLGRSFGAGGLVLVHQGVSQLPVELQTILNTNVPLRILGRSSERDAGAAAEWLPRTGRVPRRRDPWSRTPGLSAFLSEAEEERFRIAEMGRLPARCFLVADRRVAFAPRIVRAPEYNPPPWSAIDPEVADAVRRGVNGFPRAELEARVREIEERASARLEEHARAERHHAGRGATPVTPDVVGNAGRRGRRGEVP